MPTPFDHPTPDLDRPALVALLAKRTPGDRVSLRHAKLAGVDLHGLDFRDVDLSNADLSGCNVGGCRFNRSILDGVTMTGAAVTDADFRGASLREADLSAATDPMFSAEFGGADLTGANLAAAQVGANKLDGAKLARVYRIDGGHQWPHDPVSMKLAEPARFEFERKMTAAQVTAQDAAFGVVVDAHLAGTQANAERIVADDAARLAANEAMRLEVA